MILTPTVTMLSLISDVTMTMTVRKKFKLTVLVITAVIVTLAVTT